MPPRLCMPFNQSVLDTMFPHRGQLRKKDRNGNRKKMRKKKPCKATQRRFHSRVRSREYLVASHVVMKRDIAKRGKKANKKKKGQNSWTVYIQAETMHHYVQSFSSTGRDRPRKPNPSRGLVLGIYHENVIRAGFNANGRRKWLAATVAIGSIATKSVIRQS